jgi:biotin transporter BioY
MAVETAVKIGFLATIPKDLLVGLVVAILANAIVPRLKKAQLLG